jgi:hypothetical protein
MGLGAIVLMATGKKFGAHKMLENQENPSSFQHYLG